MYLHNQEKEVVGVEGQKLLDLAVISREARRRILSTLLTARSGHLGGSLSSLELMTSLYFGGILRYDPTNPDHPLRDRVLVRGHLGPLRYSLFSMLDWINENELYSYRQLHSRLQGHETMTVTPGVDITPSGSLGMLLSFGVGAAYSFRVRGLEPKTYVFLGDGEEQEGNVSEAARHASNLGLDNLVCIVDRNQKQLSMPTHKFDGGSDLAEIWTGYGWSVRIIDDGHSFSDIIEAFSLPLANQQPTLYIANTIKGKGIKGADEHTSGYHTIRTCPEEIAVEAKQIEDATASSEQVLSSAIQRRIAKIKPLAKPLVFRRNVVPPLKLRTVITNGYDEALMGYLRQISDAFRENLAFYIYYLTADWTPCDLAEGCGFFDKGVNYIDVGIREQHMFAMSHGIAVSDKESVIVVIDGDFLSLRAADQMQAISQAGSRIIIIGTDSGICQAMNGSTHQSSGQPGALICMPGMTFLEPADSIDLKKCLEWSLANPSGPVYIRLHSGSVEMLSVYESTRNINAYIVYQPISKIDLVIVASGLTVDGSVKFARKCDDCGLGIRVINVVNPNELGESFVNMIENLVPILTIYNGNPHILQSAVARAIMESSQTKKPSVVFSHGFLFGTSGRLNDLLSHFRFDEKGIESVVREKFGDCLFASS